jgi:hypothetical protein
MMTAAKACLAILATVVVTATVGPVVDVVERIAYTTHRATGFEDGLIVMWCVCIAAGVVAWAETFKGLRR